MSSERVAVVVSAHRMYATLEGCLLGFQAILPRLEDLIFVDNGSTEYLGGLLGARFPGIGVIRLEQNKMFCGGYNAGIQFAMDRDYEFVLIANADTEVINPQFLNELVQTARRWPKAAFLGPLVYLRSRQVAQNTCLPFPGILRQAAIWLPWHLVPGLFSHLPAHDAKVDFLNGVCVFCRVSALRSFGLMDETYGGYLEDADWSWRAKARGWNSLFTPVPSLIHHEETVGYEHYSLKSFLLKRNTVLWYLKAGRKTSALIYAKASLGLARLRMFSTRDQAKKRKHDYFLCRLSQAYHGLLAGQEISEWFGPPLSPWDSLNRGYYDPWGIFDS